MAVAENVPVHAARRRIWKLKDGDPMQYAWREGFTVRQACIPFFNERLEAGTARHERYRHAYAPLYRSNSNATTTELLDTRESTPTAQVAGKGSRAYRGGGVNHRSLACTPMIMLEG